MCQQFPNLVHGQSNLATQRTQRRGCLPFSRAAIRQRYQRVVRSRWTGAQSRSRLAERSQRQIYLTPSILVPEHREQAQFALLLELGTLPLSSLQAPIYTWWPIRAAQ